MSSKGYKHTLEARARIGAASRGRKKSEETKRKIGLANKISLKGNIPWNKGKTGVYSKESIARFSKARLENPTMYWLGKKRPELQGEKNKRWKGDDVGYWSLHAWVQRQLGKAKKCDHCLSEKKNWYHWSNISGKYKRELNDWQRLCVPCHSKFDKNRV